jgi:hypothetical protein
MSGSNSTHANSPNDEVDDYMSLSFIVEDTATKHKKQKNKETHQQLLVGNKQQRKKQRIATQLEHMDQNLKAGLSQPIDESNKGFKLLEKFGFKKEQAGGLGKNGTGIQEPIEVRPQMLNNMKTSRRGLGKEKSIEQLQTRFKEKLIRHQANMASLESDFRQSLKYIQECKQMRGDVIRAEKIIEQLDQRFDIDSHSLWPRPIVVDEAEHSITVEEHDVDGIPERQAEGEDDDINSVDYPTLLQKLETRITYLRSTHTYCLYCGCSFEDFDDMCDNCDGPMRDDH